MYRMNQVKKINQINSPSRQKILRFISGARNKNKPLGLLNQIYQPYLYRGIVRLCRNNIG